MNSLCYTWVSSDTLYKKNMLRSYSSTARKNWLLVSLTVSNTPHISAHCTGWCTYKRRKTKRRHFKTSKTKRRFTKRRQDKTSTHQTVDYKKTSTLQNVDTLRKQNADLQNVDMTKRRHIKTSTLTKHRQLQNVEIFLFANRLTVELTMSIIDFYPTLHFTCFETTVL
jgi:hypothetical protein